MTAALRVFTRRMAGGKAVRRFSARTGDVLVADDFPHRIKELKAQLLIATDATGWDGTKLAAATTDGRGSVLTGGCGGSQPPLPTALYIVAA